MTVQPRRYDLITLFPEMFAALLEHGISGRAQTLGLYQATCWNPRDFTSDRHRTVDDRPFGGGPGMVMLAEPLDKTLDAIEESQRTQQGQKGKVIYLSPQGRQINHRKVMELVDAPCLTLLCGRYEGVDQRLLDARVDEEISLGDFVLSGGELAAMVLLDAIIRQLPGAVNDAASVIEDSYVDGLLDCPHYTRPRTYKGQEVPVVLMSGDHKQIHRWRLQQSLLNTHHKRPDLLAQRGLTPLENKLLESAANYSSVLTSAPGGDLLCSQAKGHSKKE